MCVQEAEGGGLHCKLATFSRWQKPLHCCLVCYIILCCLLVFGDKTCNSQHFPMLPSGRKYVIRVSQLLLMNFASNLFNCNSLNFPSFRMSGEWWGQKIRRAARKWRGGGKIRETRQIRWGGKKEERGGIDLYLSAKLTFVQNLLAFTFIDEQDFSLHRTNCFDVCQNNKYQTQPNYFVTQMLWAIYFISLGAFVVALQNKLNVFVSDRLLTW